MPFDSTKPHQFIAYVCTDPGADIARSVMERSGGNKAAVHGGGLSGAARLSGDLPKADIILTEIGNIPVEMACECVTEIYQTGADVIVVGERTDIETYRALRKAGALEYFTFPVDVTDVLAVQPLTPPIVEFAQPATQSPSIAVLGSNGGVGASLFAQNLAFHASAAKGANKRTALLDADLHFGSQAIDLDRDETVGLFEALKAPERIDATFIGATMEHLNDRLSLYSHQARNGQAALSYEAGLAPLLTPLRTEFDTVIIDLPRTTIMQQPEIAYELDVLVVVIPAGFSGVNAASRLIERIKETNPDLHVLPILSELRRDARLRPKDIAATVGHPLAGTLPNCAAPLMRAHLAARPVIEIQPRGAYAKAVDAVWKAAFSEMTEAKKATRHPLLKRLFG